MKKPKVVIADCYYERIAEEREIIRHAGEELFDYHCATEDEVISAAADCDALICQFAPITARVIRAMPRCKVCLLYTSPSPRDRQKSRMPSSA